MSSARADSRFSRRVFLGVAAMLLAVSTIFTTYFILAQKQTLETAAADRSRAIGGLLSTGARVGVYAESAELVEETLSLVVSRRGMLSAAVFALDGRLAAAAGRTPDLKAAAGRLDAEQLGMVRLLWPGGQCLSRREAGAIEAFCPVVLRERGASADLAKQRHGALAVAELHQARLRGYPQRCPHLDAIQPQVIDLEV